jgi:hypothetical protein
MSEILSTTSGRLSSLNTAIGPSSVIFPNDLPSLKHWVSFRISKYVYRSQELPPSRSLLGAIALPVPSQLNTGYNANYDNQSLGVLGSIAAATGQAATDAGFQGAFNSLKEQLGSERIRGVLSSGALSLLQSEIGTLAGLATGGIGGGVAAAGAQNILAGALAGAGVAQNPHLATLFTGTGFRVHSFNYKLIARNETESNRIRDIIRMFKYHMSPEYILGNHFFEYPDIFDIDFHYPRYLFNIGPSVLTSFNVDYHGEGGAYYYNNSGYKAPFSVNIYLSFQETTITTKSEIKNFNR